MPKKIVQILPIIPVLFFIGWIGYLKISEINAPQYQIAVRGYDPRDLLSGHYLSLRPDWFHTDCGQFDAGRCPQEKFETSYRFYVPEENAQDLEKLLMRATARTELLFAWPHNAAPRIKMLLIGGKPWQEYLSQAPHD